MKSAAARLFAAVIASLALLPGLRAQSTPVLTTVYTFSSAGMDVIKPDTLIQGSDGNFYGTTDPDNAGAYAVFSITPAGVGTTLHIFSSTEGNSPSALVQGSDGNFYGTTSQGGGSNGYGTVFSITPAGVETTLHIFNDTDGGGPNALIQGSDGNFYGTTAYGGGSNGTGTVFSITPAGVLTTLHIFNGTDGNVPNALLQGSDGNFYGTTVGNSSQNNYGTVFSMTPAGDETTLHIFNNTDGYAPTALIQGGDGNFYGTTQQGGGNGEGTVFSITPAGVLTTLHVFDGTDGYAPNALIQGGDGSFYGTTTGGGGNNGEGTVFSITPAGVLTTLHVFDDTDGNGPNTLLQGNDGNFYGTTYMGGANSYIDDGTVFKLSFVPAVATVQFAAASFNTTENAGTFSIPVSRTGDTSAALTVQYSVQGSAVNGQDYGSLPGELTIPAGAADATLDVPIIDRSIYDGSTRTLSLTLSPSANYAVGTVASATLTILDNDTAPQPTITIASPPDGSTFAVGAVVPFAASVSDPGGILSKVAITVNGLPAYQSTGKGPFVKSVDTSPFPAGDYVVVATATDDQGRTNTSTATVHLVAATPGGPPPTAALLTPVNGLDLAAGSSLTLSFTAATSNANASLAKVSLYADGALVASFDGSGNQLQGIAADHPVRRDAAQGTNILQAKYGLPGQDKLVNMVAVALDSLGLTTVSTVASFHSKVTTDLAPLVAITGLADGARFTAGKAASANVTASDPDAAASSSLALASGPHRTDASGNAVLAKLAFYLDGSFLSQAPSLTPPFAFNFTPTQGGKNVLHAVATDGSGLSTVSEPVVVDVDATTVNLAVGGTGAAVEGGANGVIVISRTGDTSQPLTINYKAKGAPVAGVDYKALPGSVTIPAGAVKAKIKVKPLAGLAGKGTLKLKLQLLTPADGSYEVGTGIVKLKLIGG